MLMFDKGTMTERAQQLSFQAGAFEKACRLANILRFLNETDEMRNALALKGGTAMPRILCIPCTVASTIDIFLLSNVFSRLSNRLRCEFFTGSASGKKN